MSVKQRLKEYLKYKKVSERAFADEIGVSSGYVSSISKSIQPDKLLSISRRYPDLNQKWLLTGEGGMLLNSEDDKAKGDDSISIGKVIPFFDADAAAGANYSVSLEPLSKPSGSIDIGGFLRDSESAIRIYGNSMTPNYPAGCIVGVKVHTDRFIEPGNVYVIETDDNRYLKRLYYNDDKTAFLCISDNHMIDDSGPRAGKLYYPEFEVPYEDVRRLFRVVGVIKRNIL